MNGKIGISPDTRYDERIDVDRVAAVDIISMITTTAIGVVDADIEAAFRFEASRTLARPSDRHAATAMQDLAVHKAAAIIKQKGDGIGDIGGLTEATDRNRGAGFLV